MTWASSGTDPDVHQPTGGSECLICLRWKMLQKHKPAVVLVICFVKYLHRKAVEPWDARCRLRLAWCAGYLRPAVMRSDNEGGLHVCTGFYILPLSSTCLSGGRQSDSEAASEALTSAAFMEVLLSIRWCIRTNSCLSCWHIYSLQNNGLWSSASLQKNTLITTTVWSKVAKGRNIDGKFREQWERVALSC